MQWGAQKNHVTICMFKKLRWLKGLTRRVNSSPTPKTANRCGGVQASRWRWWTFLHDLNQIGRKNGHNGPEKWTLYGKSKKAGRDVAGILPLKMSWHFISFCSDCWTCWNSVLFMKEISQAKAHFVNRPAWILRDFAGLSPKENQLRALWYPFDRRNPP